MPCNFLFKLDTSDKYEHKIISGCSGSRAQQAVIAFFKDKYPNIMVYNFDSERENICPFIWSKTIEGVSIVEEKYEIYVSEVTFLKDQSKPATPENTMKGRGLLSKVVESKPLILLDYFKDDV